MECWKALEIVEGLELDVLSGQDPLAKAARDHLASCPTCAAAETSRLAWSRRLAAAMSDVSVPHGEPDRIAAMLSLAAPSTASTLARKVWLWRAIGLSAAALLLLAIFVSQPWMWRTGGERPLLEVLITHIDCDLATLTPVDGPLRPVLPRSWRSYFVWNPQLVLGFPPDGVPEAQMAAVVPFQFHTRVAEEPLRGRLVMVPQSRVPHPPIETSFDDAERHYAGTSAWCAWTEGEWVYVCYMRRGAADLQRLQQALRDRRTFT